MYKINKGSNVGSGGAKVTEMKEILFHSFQKTVVLVSHKAMVFRYVGEVGLAYVPQYAPS